MDASLIVLFIIQTILIIILALFLYVILKETKILKFEKRISDYSLTSTIDDEDPLFEDFYNKCWNVVKRISKIISKSEILKKYAKKYDKYINYDDRKRKNNIDFISIKIIISLIICILYVLSTFINVTFNSQLLLLIFVGSFFVYDIYLNIQYKKRKKEIENELLNAIIIMNNAFKSGMNIMQAVDIVKKEISGPIQDEFKKVSIDISYGLRLETVFERFYNREELEDIKYITSSLALINKTGGNIVRVFTAIEKTFYDKKKIKDEMNSLTSSSVFMFRMLVFMPILLILIIYILNPSYFVPFFTTTFGRMILVLIIILFSVYVFVVRKILKVNI